MTTPRLVIGLLIVGLLLPLGGGWLTAAQGQNQRQSQRGGFNATPTTTTTTTTTTASRRRSTAFRNARRQAVRRQSLRRSVPPQLQARLQRLSGQSNQTVRVSSGEFRGSAQVTNAHARRGSVHLVANAPSLLPHEAWHVVQQRGVRG
jgi:uncharacterized protein HemX